MAHAIFCFDININIFRKYQIRNTASVGGDKTYNRLKFKFVLINLHLIIVEIFYITKLTNLPHVAKMEILQ